MKGIYPLWFLIIFSSVQAQINLLPYQEFPAGNWAETLSVGDINNDGINEVVVGSRYGHLGSHYTGIQVFTQDGNNGFDSSGVYTTSTYSFIQGIDIGDINNDGLNDVVIGYNDYVGYFLQKANGNLDAMQSMYSGKGVNGLRLADLNNDGLTDILASQRQATFIKVFYQSNTGFTSAEYSKPKGARDEIEVGDVNSDGLLDVVYMSGSSNSGVHVFTQNATGGLNDYVYYPFSAGSFSSTNGLALGDLNQDGALDVVTSKGGNTPTAGILIWYQDPTTGTLHTPPTEIAAFDIPEPVEIADLDCNGANEIITAHGGWHALSVYEDSSGSFGPYLRLALPYASHYHPQGLEIADVNNDGLEDVVIAEYAQGLVVLFNNSSVAGTTHDTAALLTGFDTLSTFFSTADSMITINSMDSNGTYLMLTSEVYQLKLYYRSDSIAYDSVSIVTTSRCGNSFSNSVHHVVYTFYDRLLRIDSSHISTTITQVNPFTSIAIYPNPTSTEVNIELPSPYDRMPVNASIHDVHGSLLYHVTWAGITNKRKLDFSNYADAIYMLNIYGEGFFETIRIIKQ